MKQKALKRIFLILSIFVSHQTFAYDFEVDGIYYLYSSYYNSAQITYGDNKYKGSVVIPSSISYNGRTLNVTHIATSAFAGCNELTAITLPSTIVEIGQSAFNGCSSLTTIKIPNSVNIIKPYVFKGCSNLVTLILEDGEGDIADLYDVGSGHYAEFYPKYVYYGRNASNDRSENFWRRLNEHQDSIQVLTFGPKVTKIAAIGFSNLKVIYCMMEEPATIIESFSFGGTTYANTKVYVPIGSKDKYVKAKGWDKFFLIQEMDVDKMWNGEGDPYIGNLSNEKCEKPTISYSKGKLTFTSGTEGAICKYNITDADITAGSGNEVQLTVTYNLSVYATKAGYENSETATATLCWVDQVPTTEGLANDISQIPARAVLIQSQGGLLTIQGVDDGSNLVVYNISGQMVGSTKANGNQASLATNIKKGEVAIIKIDEKSVKVVMQ